MAKHKDPSEVTIASTQQRTIVHDWVERHWKTGVMLAVVGTAAILIPHYLRQRSSSSSGKSWDRLGAEVGFSFGSVQARSPAVLATLADEFRGESLGAWAKTLEITGEIQAGKYDAASKAAEQLRSGWPEHPLAHDPLLPGPGGAPSALADVVASRARALELWEKEHPFLFSNPELPADAPRVRLNTSKGALVVGLYSDRAPLHVENFLKRCRDGSYNGTRFHRVVRGTLIQGGDPNTVSGEPETWGTGGSETSLEPEIDPALRHFKGALSAWKIRGENRSSGSQFFLTTADHNEMDGQYTVFGRLLEGDSVVEAIESGAVVGDRPQDPVVLESTEVLGG